jgi:hypothetical protein
MRRRLIDPGGDDNAVDLAPFAGAPSLAEQPNKPEQQASEIQQAYARGDLRPQ